MPPLSADILLKKYMFRAPGVRQKKKVILVYIFSFANERGIQQGNTCYHPVFRISYALHFRKVSGTVGASPSQKRRPAGGTCGEWWHHQL